jgi:hypothetical protein
MVERPLNFFIKIKTNKIVAIRLEGLFRAGNKMGCSLLSLDFEGFTLWPSKSQDRGRSWPRVWTLGLAFRGFTLCPAEGLNSYILLAIFSPFLWIVNIV